MSADAAYGASPSTLRETVRDSCPQPALPMPDNLGFDSFDYDDLLRWVPNLGDARAGEAHAGPPIGFADPVA